MLCCLFFCLFFMLIILQSFSFLNTSCHLTEKKLRGGQMRMWLYRVAPLLLRDDAHVCQHLSLGWCHPPCVSQLCLEGTSPCGSTAGEGLARFGEEQGIWPTPSIFFQWCSMFSRRKYSPEEPINTEYSPDNKKEKIVFINCFSSVDVLILVS